MTTTRGAAAGNSAGASASTLLRVLRRGRPLLALDQAPAQVHGLLHSAGLHADEHQARRFRELYLRTPGLDRVASAVLLAPDTLHDPAPAGAGRALVDGRRVPIGVRMGDETTGVLATDIDEGDLARDVARHVAAGASFARWRIVAGHGPGGHVSRGDLLARSRLVGRWAAVCRRGGLEPLVDCVIRPGPRDGLDRATRSHAAAVAAVEEGLAHGTGGDVGVLALTPVVPGPRSGGPVTPQDVAHATVRSLQEAGSRCPAVLLTSPSRDRRLAAYLAAVQWAGPDRPFGFLLGGSVLRAAARAWRGRPRHERLAHQELHASLLSSAALLQVSRNEVLRRAKPGRCDGAVGAVGAAL